MTRGAFRVVSRRARVLFWLPGWLYYGRCVFWVPPPLRYHRLQAYDTCDSLVALGGTDGRLLIVDFTNIVASAYHVDVR